jgi:hypothetical protein
MTDGFHNRDHWFFARVSESGDVRIRKRAMTGTVEHPVVAENEAIIAEIVIPENEWASIVASVSRGGETSHSWQFVRDFHGGESQQNMRHLASAMKKMLPPALLAEVIDHLDPLTPFLRALRDADNDTASAGSTPAREEQQAERFKDALQAAFNAGAFICPLAGRDDKPENHARYCQACRVRGWLTSGWYLRPDADKPKVGEELVTALKEYGTHHKSCPIASNWKRKGQDGNWYPVPCNCGFAAVLATYDPPSGSAAPAQET